MECNSALDDYERIPHENIQEILRISYDGLKEFEKEMFLDIACFFNGYFLIEDMGREIVRQQSASKSYERNRLWFFKDILQVFKENKGSNNTEIIMLHLPKYEDVQWDGKALKKMENLKILVVKNARLSRPPISLPKILIVLIWCGYPETSLPYDYDTKELVILDSSLSLFTFKNQLNMKFKSLMELKLSGCKLVKEVPDMSGASSLKIVHLGNCKNLVKVHDSVGFLDKLEWLKLSDYTSLRVLHHGMNLTSLEVNVFN